ncbi:EpsG family protein [Acinetobacter bereziniae]|uniref:EpsG family protein n=1 Tax=Acinetobacter bereziniae NIPH 3 TaxID=1217651 RepID=N8YMF1_ACIBZ|nr:EpsG family protein [Acinetobacter bereziniae]ENV20738.1 hypothetical protein F963_03320 [Acinetobacter bereziniae NIPH 3]
MFTVVTLSLYLFVLYSLPNRWFRDRDIYIIYAENYDTFLKEDESFKQLINEPLFSQIAGLFTNFPELFPTFMSLFIASIYFIFTFKLSKNFITFLLGFTLLIFNSYLIFQQLFQLRQGLATALFVIIFFSIKSLKFRVILSCVLPFIHVSFFIITPIFILYELYLKNIKSSKIMIMTSIGTIIFSLLSVTLMYIIGFRQADLYESINEGKGGGSLLLHFIILIYVYFFTNRENKKLFDWTIIGLSFFIFSYYIFPAAGRLFSSFYPFLLFHLISRSKYQDITVLLIMNIVFITLFFTSGYLDMLTMDAYFFNIELENFINKLF